MYQMVQQPAKMPMKDLNISSFGSSDQDLEVCLGYLDVSLGNLCGNNNITFGEDLQKAVMSQMAHHRSLLLKYFSFS